MRRFATGVIVRGWADKPAVADKMDMADTADTGFVQRSTPSSDVRTHPLRKDESSQVAIEQKPVFLTATGKCMSVNC